ncbi:MAG: alpha/beta hydrolase [Candidatus Coproplasma sp.]
MKKALKIVLIVAGCVAGASLTLLGFCSWAAKQPVVKDGYFNDVSSQCEGEKKYTLKGESEVEYYESDAGSTVCAKYEVWYPANMQTSDKTYPLVVMANGTGVPASRYKPVFDHLASWGFIVVGNEDGNSWSGESSSLSLDYMLSLNADVDSIFYGKIDEDNIGIAGHSQGGVGAINAVTAQENGVKYKTIYTASATHIVLSEALNWPYDVSKIQIPYFMTAGTLTTDAGDGVEGSDNVGIAPLFSLQENFAAIDGSVTKIMARRVNADHGDMLAQADGYMTAWLCYWLKGDTEAKDIFFGDDAEILTNANWQDVERKNLD